MVRVGDRLDDREPQPMAAVVAGAGPAQPLEGRKEPADLLGRDGGAGVGDRREGVPVAGAGGDLDASESAVVADRVVDQVGDQALEQPLVARRRRRGDRGATSISARWRVSGARSSWEALATNWRCAW
jgi:hypothetical protein